MHRATRFLLAAGVIPFAFAACADAGSDTGWTMTVDTLPSGTVTVVNTPPSDDAGRPTWVLEEELRIGSIDQPGPATFGQIRALVVDDAGRMIVLESQAQEIRVFDANGAHVATHGGQGGGPGEFQNALGIMQTSDGLLYVPDNRNTRMSVLDPDSGFIRSYPLTLYRWGFVWDGRMRDDDHIIIPSMVFETRRDLLRIYALDMTQVDTILLPEQPQPNRQDPPGAFAWRSADGRMSGFTQVPFYATASSFIDRTGQIWSATAGDPSYRVTRWTPGGDTTLILQTLRLPVPVTEAERDSVLDGIREHLSNYGVREIDASKVPNVKPGVLALFTDDAGRLWVRTSSPNERRLYDVYERDGRYVGTLATSLPIITYLPPVVRGDAFYAIVVDEFDVQYIVRARIVDAPRED